jgi:hypothetical protein
MANKIKTILDDVKFKLTAKPIENGARPPTLQLSTYINNPQLVVYPNHDNGSGVTWINAGMDVNTFSFLLEVIEFLASPLCKNGEQIEIENKRDIPKEKRQDPKVTKQVVTKTQVGRDDEGCIWISVQDTVKANAPKIRFYFNVNYYHAVRSKLGLTRADFSQFQARAWVRNARLFMSGILLNNPNATADLEEARAKFGGNKGGYNSNKGGGNKQPYNNNQANSTASGAAQSADNFGGDNFDDGWDE